MPSVFDSFYGDIIVGAHFSRQSLLDSSKISQHKKIHTKPNAHKQSKPIISSFSSSGRERAS
jgi:hypothetical protein